jgi:hypothetical protein
MVNTIAMNNRMISDELPIFDKCYLESAKVAIYTIIYYIFEEKIKVENTLIL